MISLAIEASGGRREWRTDGGLTVRRCSEAAVASPRSCAASEVGEAGHRRMRRGGLEGTGRGGGGQWGARGGRRSPGHTF
jgi:hypothetical protein